MVKLHIKKGDESQFLFETVLDESVDDTTLAVTAIYNGRLKVSRICMEMEELAKHGTMLPGNMMGLTDEQIEELKLVDEWGEKCIPSGGWTFNKDDIGRRNGHQPSDKMQEVILKTVEEAKAILSKKQVQADVCITLKMVQQALDILRGAMMIVYPMNLPPHDVIRQELENIEDLSGTQASLEVIDVALAQLWFSGKEMLRGKKLSDYLGRNEKTKVIVKLSKMGHGPPGREPVVGEEERKQMMLHAYRRQEELKMPQSEAEWNEIAQVFEEKWNFPNRIGAIDGKHIALIAPFHSGSEFFNYKGFFSIVLMAVVDANYNFIYVNVGCQGRISDGGVFNNTFFKKALEENSLHLPPPRALPGRTTLTPFVLVADDAFPLTPDIMKPYSGIHDKGSKKRIFGYRLSRARRVSENAFGVLSACFRVFRSPMALQPEVATKVTMAAVYLHNFLRKTSSKSVYNPRGIFDSESTEDGELTLGLWRRDASSSLRSLSGVPRRSTTLAQSVRDEFADFFISPQGEVTFQHNK